MRKNYPPVDVLTTRSRLLEDDRVAAADVDLARRIRELITARRAAETDPALALDAVLSERAKKLQAFFSQPFFVAEPYTKRPGSIVSRASALRDMPRNPRRRARRPDRGRLLFYGRH